MKRLAAFLVVLMGCSSCMTMFIRPLYTRIVVESEPDGVLVEVIGDGEVLKSRTTPATMYVRNADGMYMRFSKPGFKSEVIELQSNGVPAKVGLSGILNTSCLWTGMLYDDYSGALERISPENIRVRLRPE